MLGVCQRVAAIPMKRAAPAETHFLEHDEMEALFRDLCRPPRSMSTKATRLVSISS